MTSPGREDGGLLEKTSAQVPGLGLEGQVWVPSREQAPWEL